MLAAAGLAAAVGLAPSLAGAWWGPGWGGPGWGYPGWGYPGWGYPVGGWGYPGWGYPGWGGPLWGPIGGAEQLGHPAIKPPSVQEFTRNPIGYGVPPGVAPKAIGPTPPEPAQAPTEKK